MTDEDREVIPSLQSGVQGFDTVLGGGLPEYSFNLIAGGPGSGKTILAHQIMFANATTERPALYFTVLGEPTADASRTTSSISKPAKQFSTLWSWSNRFSRRRG